jgi:AraC-like DNA-binding protein/tetratricopeptide (TPR) repeat protein
MSPHLRPWYLKNALELIESDPARPWTVGELARASGVARRTLQQSFRRCLSRSPIEHLRRVRLQLARQELLAAPRDGSITQIAARCGFSHLGRFSIWYRERYGETPSTTLQYAGISMGRFVLPLLSSSFERPVVAILPFDLIGEEAHRATGMADGIAAALLHQRWIGVSTVANARYRLRGKVHGNGRGGLRVTVLLIDGVSGRTIWADHWDGRSDDVFEFEERVAVRAARAIEPALRDAEIDRASRNDREQSSAWELTMRALPGVLSYDPAAEAMALELLERAMELAPHDPLPMALAAWCYGVRSCLHFTSRPQAERDLSRMLAARAARQNKGDALTETALAASYTLANDLSMAALHVDRALLLNGGSAWAWGRSAWIGAYRGEGTRVIERFKIARTLAPIDPLSAMCCFGIAAPLMEADRHAEAIPWINRGVAEGCKAGWINPFLAAAYALENRKDEAERCLVEWKRAYPEMTIAQIRSGLPFGPALFDRVAEGLESAGLRSPK